MTTAGMNVGRSVDRWLKQQGSASVVRPPILVGVFLVDFTRLDFCDNLS